MCRVLAEGRKLTQARSALVEQTSEVLDFAVAVASASSPFARIEQMCYTATTTNPREPLPRLAMPTLVGPPPALGQRRRLEVGLPLPGGSSFRARTDTMGGAQPNPNTEAGCWGGESIPWRPSPTSTVHRHSCNIPSSTSSTSPPSATSASTPTTPHGKPGSTSGPGPTTRLEPLTNSPAEPASATVGAEHAPPSEAFVDDDPALRYANGHAVADNEAEIAAFVAFLESMRRVPGDIEELRRWKVAQLKEVATD